MSSFGSLEEQIALFFLPLDLERRDDLIEEHYILSQEKGNTLLCQIGEKRSTNPQSYETDDLLLADLHLLHKAIEEGQINDEILLQTFRFNDFHFFLLLLLAIHRYPFQ